MKRGIGFFILILTLSIMSLFAQDKSKIIALEEQLASADTDAERLRLYGELCWNYSFTSYNKALRYGNEELALATKMRNDTAIALAYSDIGIVHIRANNLQDGLLYNTKAYELRKKLGLKSKMAGSLTNLAVVYKQLGNFDKSVQYMMEALHVYTDIGDEAKQAILLNNLGKFYLDNDKPEDAKNYLKQSITLSQKLKLAANEANAEGNLMAYYMQKEQYSEAVKLGNRCLKIYNSLNDQGAIATIYNTMGVLYHKMKDYNKAIEYNRRSIVIRRQLKDQLGIGSCYKNLASVYIDIGEAGKAKEYLDKAIDIFKNAKAKNYLQDAYNLTAKLNEKQETYKNALEYTQLSQKIKDSIFDRNTADKINELQIKYETAKKEQHIKLLHKQNIIQGLQIDKRNTTIAIIGGLFFIALAFTALFYNRYKLKQDARLQAEIIKQQDFAAKGIIEAEERERKRIASDLHDGVGQLFSAVKMNMNGLLERMQFPTEPERLLAQKTLALVDESCVEVRSIAHQMMPNVLMHSGLVSAVKNFLGKIDNDQLKIQVEAIGLNERLDSDVETVLYRVIQECVNNVIKHANATLLDIQFIYESHELTITIEDNGKGFDMNDNEKTEGIGLQNIKKRIEYLRGTVDVSAAIGKGVLIAIYVPM